MLTYPFKFEINGTNQTRLYAVSPHWTGYKLYDEIRNQVRNDFGRVSISKLKFYEKEIAETNTNLLQLIQLSLNNFKFNTVAFYIIFDRPQERVIDDDHHCSVCLTTPRNLLFLPCRHLSCCETCGSNDTIQICVICRVPIETKIRVFF